MSNAQQLALPGVMADAANEWVWAEDEEGENGVTFVHETVMKHEVTAALAAHGAMRLYDDVTLGWGAHRRAILEAAPGARVIAFDRDEIAVQAARERLLRFGDRVTIVQANFASAREKLTGAWGSRRCAGFALIWRVSSPQLDDPWRAE